VFRIVRFRRDKEATYQAEQNKKLEKTQRWMLLAGGAGYGLAGLWMSVAFGDTEGVFSAASIALMIGTLILWSLTYTDFLRTRLDVVPVIVALAYSFHQMFSMTLQPDGGEMRAAFLFGILATYTTLMAPTVQSALGAILTSLVVAGLGLGLLLPSNGVHLDVLTIFIFAAPLIAIAAALAVVLDYARREAYSYKHELGRRATTDDISGVSNRSHIYQLAQNEFGRARRYKEPLSMLLIEIDGFDAILAETGPMAAQTVLQVFSGYCVIVMRHCDSFGRLGPKRFLALLPETPSKGAMVLAERMCRELAELDVILEDEAMNFSVSIGAAEAHANDKWAGDTLRRCTQALDDAIDSGRDKAVLAMAPRVANTDTAMGNAGTPPMIAGGAGSMLMPDAEQSPDMRQSA
jgi:diguanylate cyclase (GGDEF)-like protein